MSRWFTNRGGCEDRVRAEEQAFEGHASDEELMIHLQQGNGEAFTVLFDRYNRLVLTIALRHLHDAAEAQEVTQDIFFEFYRSARRFDPSRGKLKVWLLQFAYSRSINRRNYLLIRQFYNRPDLDDAVAWEASAKSTPRIPAQELKQIVSEAMITLPEAQKAVVEKVIFEGLTLREVAERSGTTYNSVRNRYYRGLAQLRACLSEAPARAAAETSEASERILGFGEVSRGKA